MNTKLKMQEVDIDLLAPNPWNTNVVAPENEAKLDESLRRYGAFKPIVVREMPDGTLQILGGEHRWGAMRRAGYVKVPVVNLGAISETKAKEIGLVDNGRYGEDDSVGLAQLLRELGNDIATVLPYTDAEIQNILDATSIALEDLDSIGKQDLPDLSKVSVAPTHQVMRFKVPVEDVAWASGLIERAMKSQGFTSEDSLSNAGHALVWMLKQFEKSQ